MKIKRFYFSPHLEVTWIVIDGAIASQSACAIPTDAYGNIYEVWEDDPEVVRTIDW